MNKLKKPIIMKTTTISIAILGIMLSMLLVSCNNNNTYSIEATVIVDQTEDTFLAKPDLNAIKQLFPADSDPWQGYYFRMLAITDVDYNPVFQAEIAPACEYLSNSYDRNDEVQKFFLEIDSAFQKTNAVPSGKTRSSIYIPLARELKHLSESTAKRRVLIVYSDFMEYSFLTDFYKKTMLEKMEDNPETIQQMLEKAAPLPDLKGIEIKIIYQPRNNAESKQFDIVSGFYKNLLESKGATVTIGANLI